MGPRFSLGVIVVLGIAVLAGTLVGRSQSTSTAAQLPPTAVPTPMPTAEPSHINILPDPSRSPLGVYSPQTYTMRAGQKVTWINLASDDHTVSADNGAFTSNVLATGQTFSWKPKKAGTYTYSCFIHPDMRGTIVVNP